MKLYLAEFMYEADQKQYYWVRLVNAESAIDARAKATDHFYKTMGETRFSGLEIEISLPL